MNHRQVVVLLAASLVWMVNEAQCAEGMYAGGALGLVSASDADAVDPFIPNVTGSMSFDSGYGLLASIGYGFDTIRVEGEWAYQKNDLDSLELLGKSVGLNGDVTVWSLLANGYYDIPIGSDFFPFVTAGLGFAQVSMNDFNTKNSGEPDWSGDDIVFAWQLGAGVGYTVNNQLTVEATYRYFATTEADFDDGSSLDFASHNIYLGLRYTF